MGHCQAALAAGAGRTAGADWTRVGRLVVTLFLSGMQTMVAESRSLGEATIFTSSGYFGIAAGVLAAAGVAAAGTGSQACMVVEEEGMTGESQRGELLMQMVSVVVMVVVVVAGGRWSCHLSWWAGSSILILINIL